MTDDIQVLMWVPETGTPSGGHRIQMEMTARHLADLEGVTVRLCESHRPDWDGVDVVHGMGITTDQVREARRRGIPVSLSVIYWSSAYRSGQTHRETAWRTIAARGRVAAAFALASGRGEASTKAFDFAKWAVETVRLYEAADLLLPNSRMEADQLAADLAVTTPVEVIPNAVDPALFSIDDTSTEREGVVYVGRVEPHKNQLQLIRALRDTSIPLTIIGAEHPHHPRYAAQVRKEAGKNVRLVGQVPHDELAAYYRSAQVHALPSLFETTGLVSLEAALCGCNVVTTEMGYAREYLEDMAWYCDPDDLESIRNAVRSALAAPPQEGLRRRILERYTWQHTASATAAAYRAMLRAMRQPERKAW